MGKQPPFEITKNEQNQKTHQNKTKDPSEWIVVKKTMAYQKHRTRDEFNQRILDRNGFVTLPAFSTE